MTETRLLAQIAALRRVYDAALVAFPAAIVCYDDCRPIWPRPISKHFDALRYVLDDVCDEVESFRVPTSCKTSDYCVAAARAATGGT